jgi:hypothetical protein
LCFGTEIYFSIEAVAFEAMAMQSWRMNPLDRLKLQPGCGSTGVVLLIMFLLALPLGGAQNAPTSHIPGLPQPMTQGVGDIPLDPNNNGLPYDVDEARRIRMLNGERQKSLVADTVKLVKLAKELNAEIAKADASAPTPDELRKIADIEKLAHKVKEKMEITVVGTPIYLQTTLPPIP